MPKINLLGRGGSRGSETEVTQFEGNETIQFSVEDNAEGSSPIIKVLVILLWVLGLYAYEWYNIGQLDSQVQTQQKRLKSTSQQIAALQPELAKAKKLTQEHNAFKTKIARIQDIGKMRLREIRALDHLQNIIPERAWFKKIKFENSVFELEGVAANDQVVDALMSGIRRHSGFTDVFLSRVVEEKTDQGNLRAFLVIAGVGDN